MSGHTKWPEIRNKMMDRPGAAEALNQARTEFDEELRLYELRHAEALSQVEVAGRLEVSKSAVSNFEHSEDVRVSTLRDYLGAIGARLELVAVFEDDEEGRRIPVHLGKETP